MNLINKSGEKIIKIIHWNLEYLNVLRVSNSSKYSSSFELKKYVIKGM